MQVEPMLLEAMPRSRRRLDASHRSRHARLWCSVHFPLSPLAPWRSASGAGSTSTRTGAAVGMTRAPSTPAGTTGARPATVVIGEALTRETQEWEA